MPGPLRIKDKHHVARAPHRLALGPMSFLKSVKGNDVPRPIIGQVPNPGQIRRIAGKTVGKVNDFVYPGSDGR